MESGRSTPSRDMVLHLADRLDVPLRERNNLLLAAGYAVEWHTYSMPHSVSPHEVADIAAWLRRVL